MSYALVRPLLFAFDGETSHELAMRSLDCAHRVGLTALLNNAPSAHPKQVMGLEFPNPVGLAAGLDKNGEHIDALAQLGFGFIEVGTVTPRPQPGNPRPRLFRIPEARALINRMGFNNGGLERLIGNLQRTRYRGVLGINIGKNFDTPMERAIDDYLISLRAVYSHASYVAVNISSPNTKDLRQLQQAEQLSELLAALKNERESLTIKHRKAIPLVLKIAPDLDPEQVETIAGLLIQNGIDGVIATNTTVSRDQVVDLPYGNEAGGLSGRPLALRSNQVIKQLFQALHGRVPIIGVGGILGAEDALQKFDAGASLVQLYTGLIYRGPRLIHEICRSLNS
jgi:dihydroorotate dehydrogenase